jgi:uncharacterized protein with GYD domain
MCLTSGETTTIEEGGHMTTYFLMGKYTPEALKGTSAGRTQKAYKLIERLGGRVKSIHALLGEKDLIVQVELPGVKSAIKASLGLTKMTGIGFSTSEALLVSEFDRLAR